MRHYTRNITRILLLVTTLLVSAFSVTAERTATVQAEFVYYVPGNQTRDHAIAEAIRAAQIKAIADEFGTVVSETSTTSHSIDGDNSQSSFSSIGFTEVNGEWIKTIGKPEIRFDNSLDGQLVIHVKIKGKVREVKRVKPKFRSQLIRNSARDTHECTTFYTGDKMYMRFRTPSDGYLAVFSKEDSVRCFLPLIEGTDCLYSIRANRDYLLFERPEESIEMQATMPNELNTIYVLFSSNPIPLPLSNHIDEGGMPVYADEQFQKWLATMQTKDKDLQVEIKYITIVR